MKAARRGRLFVVSGPSGAGKTSLIKRFLKHDRTSTFSVSCTTRQKRPNEVDGKDYRFIDTETFQNKIAGGDFLEWESVHGNMYGTPKAEIMEELGKGLDVILDIDVKGALAVRNQCPQACLIFVEPPSREELVSRLRSRGEKEIDLRMQIIDEEMEKKSLFEYTIKNHYELDAAYKAFRDVVHDVRGKDGKDHC
jgi:guanylate kinase